MHPRLLKTFLAVVHARSFTRAAAAIHLAQSSVSDQIQTLEAELETELFRRTRHGLQLTEGGQALRSYAEEILALTEEARSAVEAVASRTEHRLTIGALETVAAARLPQLLGPFQRRHPAIRLNVKVAGSSDLSRGLAEGAIDAAFYFDRGLVDDRLVTRTVSSEPLVYIGSARREEIRPAKDPGQSEYSSFITTERGCIYRHMFEKSFADAGAVIPRTPSEVGSIAAIGRLVASGAGRAILPRLTVSDMLDRGDVVELPWPRDLGAAKLVLAWRRRRVQPAALALFLATADRSTASIKSADGRPRRVRQSRS